MKTSQETLDQQEAVGVMAVAAPGGDEEQSPGDPPDLFNTNQGERSQEGSG